MKRKFLFLLLPAFGLLMFSCKKEKAKPVTPPVIPPVIVVPENDTLQTGVYTIASSLTPTKAIGILASASPDALQLNPGRTMNNVDYLAYNNEQKWKITRYGDYYKIVSAFSGLPLALPASGKALVQQKPRVSDSLLWKVTYNVKTKAYQIANKSSLQKLVLDTANHTTISLDTATQYWKFTATKCSKLDTVTTHSDSMNKDIKAVVVTPASYGDGRSYPVVYLLHGWGDNYLGFSNNAPQIRDLADKYNFIIVCADGAFSSWYVNSVWDNKSTVKYETYVSSELVNYTDTHYKTIAARTGRAILGYSMGGHGALYNAMRHQDVFAAAGSMSGCVDLTFVGDQSLRGIYDLSIGAELGPYSGATKINWVNNSVVNMIGLLKTDGSLAINVDCGENDSDGFYPMNGALDAELTAAGIPHTYSHRPGIHSWSYWNGSVPVQFAFFAAHLDVAK